MRHTAQTVLGHADLGQYFTSYRFRGSAPGNAVVRAHVVGGR